MTKIAQVTCDASGQSGTLEGDFSSMLAGWVDEMAGSPVFEDVPKGLCASLMLDSIIAFCVKHDVSVPFTIDKYGRP